MKKAVLFVSLFVSTLLLNAQATDLFFSEYIEGTSNNKGMEIYNGTGQTVDLSQYSIKQAVNGGDWQYVHTFPTGSTIANGEVWVIITDQVDQALFSNENADEVLGYPSVTHHNGNDARGLAKNEVVIDLIGVPNEDPGDGWSVAGVSTATKDHTLIRKESVSSGNINWTESAGTNADDSEWMVFEVNTFTYLGSHTMIVGLEGFGETVETYSLYQNYPNPFNPTTQISFNLEKSGHVSLKVFNAIGQEVYELINSEMSNGSHEISFDATDLTSGIYFYTLRSGSFVSTKKMILMK